MSLFTKRKGRRISTFDDVDEPQGGGAPAGDDQSAEPIVQPIRFGKRPLKQSALRRSINIADSEVGLGEPGGSGDDETSGPTTADEDAAKPPASGTDVGNNNNDDDDGPVVVRPALSRTGSRKNRKRLSTASTSSRLSFGGIGMSGGGDDDDDDDDSGPAVVTPNKRGAAGTGTPSLTQRVLETNAFRKSLSARLPTRHRTDDSDDDEKSSRPDAGDDDDGRPRYSQAYLDELQSSTPNTPQNLAAQRNRLGEGGDNDEGDVMDLDPSELDGAMVVDASELGRHGLSPASSSAVASMAPPPPVATMLTATEIQERKDRRARRALEGDAMADDDDDAEASGDYISLLTDEQKRKKREKERTRLVREDEDLGEGFDEFVEEKEALSIGRKAQRAARRKRKEDMAALINAAEVGGDGDGDGDGQAANDAADDSDVERRLAYDAAQTRAGMDGLPKTRMRTEDDGLEHGVQGTVPIPRMRPLPDLATCLEQMQSAVAALEVDAAEHRRRLAEVEQEKAEIAARETEVQAILDAAAAKYQTVLGGGAAPGTAGVASSTPGAAGMALDMTQSPLRALPPGLAGDFPVQRGLESLGTTPTRRPNPDDVF
ncbi:hypothetical protein SPBR_03655 [Sporothrix brasiliensis 5110]|uniref:Nineteen complex-related protein 2-domain-containing protein n=1 Tax=Sporothrix brasiliensis 5110 TaxID=1398154 RepID=A0A0C2F7B3_9PEZI|nr:uncharacterized protein SPBR_03655 [Sporothrix brasiliensis 5110]KIH94854.1 hypothetical protein SPBR_03655 [Sporothrix brasiliensis 5110]